MTTPHRMLGAWPQARLHPELWQRYLEGDLGDPVMAVSAALLDPHTPDRMVSVLIQAQAWMAVELLLEDDLFRASSSTEDMTRWSAQIESARAAALVDWRARHQAILQQAQILGIPDSQLNASYKPGSNGAHDERELERLENVVREAVDAAARASAATPVIVGLPTPAPRTFSGWDLRDLLATFLGDAIPRPGLDVYLPLPSDSHAWRLLELLHAPTHDQGDTVLRCLAGLLGTEVHSLTRDAEGWLGRFSDLSAPGFAALGRARWPDGIPVWLARAANPTLPRLPGDPLLVELRVEGHRRPRPGHLILEVRELLAVLSWQPGDRRRAVLATLGAQIPLDRLFDAQIADASVAWPRDTRWLDGDAGDRRPILLSAPPGHGKTVLLQTEASARGPGVLTPADDLPENGPVFIDCDAEMDTRAARRLVQAIHWITDINTGPIVVAARPEIASLLEDVRQGFFRRESLPRWGHAETRQQAQTMLAWGAILADAPQRYDELAILSGYNPTALFHLCAALASELAEGGQRRGFDERTLFRVWRRPALQAQLRELFWDPLLGLAGFRALVETLALFGALDGRLSWTDLLWAMSAREEPVPEARVRWLAKILEEYRLISTDDDGVALRPGGPARVLVERLTA